MFWKLEKKNIVEAIKTIIYNKRYVCKHCGTECGWKNKNRFLLRCKWKACGKELNALKFTFLNKTHLNIEKVSKNYLYVDNKLNL